MPELEDAWAFLKDSDPVASAEQVQAAVERVAAEIDGRLGKSYPLVLAVMGGAIVFAGQVLPRLRFPLDFDYIHASRYGDRTSGSSTIEWRGTPPPGIEGRNVLVLDDILDGGDTMAAIRDRVMAIGARSFHCAVLVEKVLGREKPIKPDFVGLRVPDKFVFGCGMDARGYWRNLPEIRAMRQPAKEASG
jgi:hypoxanthine phosphoribosyltransferase